VTEGPAPGDIRAWLSSLEIFGVKLGLETIRTICEALDHPERAFASFHVAGTNGKGSVAAMADEALRHAGYHVGRYTSPHLVDLEERIHIDGRPIPRAALDTALWRVRDAVDALRAARRLEVHPTFFEVTTAAAFDAFRGAAIDIGVVEVGLGGRFDATNVIVPMVSVITSIALDHEQQLGTTLTAIAREKAGIIKPGVPLVVGRLPRDAYSVVAGAAAAHSAPLVAAHEGCRADATDEGSRTRLAIQTPAHSYPPVLLALRGDHQVDNAIVAVRALEALEVQGWRIGQDAMIHGLAEAWWPGRLDLRALSGGRSLLIDGAHNPAGAAALASYVQRLWPQGCPVVFGAMADKDLGGMLRPLVMVARPLIATRAPGRRAAEPAAIAGQAQDVGVSEVLVVPEIDEALDAAWARSERVVVAGSLYLAGRVLECMAEP
jgi:dihydrofolate synthase/folylpolyglutamate synthase